MAKKIVLRRKRLVRKMRKLRTKRKNVLSTIGKTLAPIPQRFITKMKYSEVVTSASGPGTYGFSTWNLNNLNQPNRGTAVGTGTSHQPYGFDSLFTLYNRFRVISCSYVLMAQAQDGSTLQVACFPANEVVTPASISQLRENPRCRYTLQGSGAAIRPIKGKVYLPSLMGRTSAEYMADDRYQAQALNSTGTLAGPSELAVLHCIAGAPSEIGPIPAINFNLTLEYTVEFFDVKPLAQS